MYSTPDYTVSDCTTELQCSELIGLAHVRHFLSGHPEAVELKLADLLDLYPDAQVSRYAMTGGQSYALVTRLRRLPRHESEPAHEGPDMNCCGVTARPGE